MTNMERVRELEKISGLKNLSQEQIQTFDAYDKFLSKPFTEMSFREIIANRMEECMNKLADMSIDDNSDGFRTVRAEISLLSFIKKDFGVLDAQREIAKKGLNK